MIRCAIVCCGVFASIALAGPLNPPAGAITSTNKTLQEVEPRIAINTTNTPGDADSTFKITQPGSYYLTANFTGVAGKHGIEIAADYVTIDLNGFTMLGVPGSLDGIGVPLVQAAVTVQNGGIRGWGNSGVGGSFNITSGVFERLDVSENGLDGIAVNDSAVIRDCTTDGNTTGISIGSRALVTGCVSRFNSAEGFFVTNGSTIIGCVAGNNAGRGYLLTGGGGAILDSTAFANGQEGIFAADRTTVTRCTATVNTLDGIRVGSDCRVVENTCSFNGRGAGLQSGIHAIGSDNRIEGNQCTDGDIGYSVDVAGNIIIRNTESGSTASGWVIAANNQYGPIIDRRTAVTSLVNGFSATTSALGTTDPNANFSY